jgi:hypothetical protein
LINTLIEHNADLWDIFIDTNNLKTIHPFGIDVFQNNLNGSAPRARFNIKCA